MDDKIESIISNARIFGSLAGKDIKTLAMMGERRQWLKGSQIISQGEEGIALNFLAHLSKRLREADKKIGGLALLNVCGRIAHTLLGIANAGSNMQEKGVLAIERLTHEDIAAMIGSSREVERYLPLGTA